MRMHLKTNVPFFANYLGSVLENIYKVMEQRLYNKGEIIVRRGEVGTEMFVVIAGTVGVYMDHKLQNCVVELQKNSTFGERSL